MDLGEDLVFPVAHVPRCDHVLANNLVAGQSALLRQVLVVKVVLILARFQQAGQVLPLDGLLFLEVRTSDDARETRLVGKRPDLSGDLVLDLLVPGLCILLEVPLLARLHGSLRVNIVKVESFDCCDCSHQDLGRALGGGLLGGCSELAWPEKHVAALYGLLIPEFEGFTDKLAQTDRTPRLGTCLAILEGQLEDVADEAAHVEVRYELELFIGQHVGEEAEYLHVCELDVGPAL